MTDDLVKRLRRLGEGAYVGAVSEDRKAAHEAADRIEQLEKGFVDILSQQPLDLLVAMIAKACLVGAIDKNGKYCFVGDLKIVDGKALKEKAYD
jgi:hypothetical protein